MSNPRRSSSLAVVSSITDAKPALVLPDMPGHIPEVVRPDFEVLVRALLEAGTWQAARMGLVENYCLAKYQVLQAQQSVGELGAFFVDEKGGVKEHPGMKTIRSAQAAMTQCCRALAVNVPSADLLQKTTEKSATAAAQEATKAQSKWAF